MENSKRIFVTGGTGNQGGSVAKALVKGGFAVKVLTRNPDSQNALDLAKIGVRLVQGDLNDVRSYKEHIKGVYGIFSVQTFTKGIENEIEQGKALATLAKESDINHFLYSSVMCADTNTGIPHFESKHIIENHVRQLDLRFTIIRPASFYENFLIPQVKKGILKGKFVTPIDHDAIQQYMAAEDIGKAVLKIFQNPEMYLGKTITLAAEQMSIQEVADVFSEALGMKMEYKKLPFLVSRFILGKDLYKMFQWVNGKPHFERSDIEATKREFPGFLDLKSWIAMNFKSK